MRKLIALTLGVIALSLLGCTDYGAWDLFRILGGDLDVLDGLAARYTFDNGGTPAADDSGNGRDGVIVGAARVIDGTRGGVLELNGSGDHVDLPSITGGAAQFTISAWINLSSPGSTIDAVYRAQTLSPRGVALYTNTDGTLRCLVDGNVPTTTATSFAFGAGDIGRWHHVAAVYDRAAPTMTLYIDGTRDIRNVLSAAADAKLDAATIGGETTAPSWFDGRIDDVRIYGRALSDIEINAIYQATR